MVHFNQLSCHIVKVFLKYHIFCVYEAQTRCFLPSSIPVPLLSRHKTPGMLIKDVANIPALFFLWLQHSQLCNTLHLVLFWFTLLQLCQHNITCKLWTHQSNFVRDVIFHLMMYASLSSLNPTRVTCTLILHAFLPQIANSGMHVAYVHVICLQGLSFGSQL